MVSELSMENLQPILVNNNVLVKVTSWFSSSYNYQHGNNTYEDDDSIELEFKPTVVYEDLKALSFLVYDRYSGLGNISIVYLKFELINRDGTTLTNPLDYDISFTFRVIQGSNDWRKVSNNSYVTGVQCSMYELDSEFTYRDYSEIMGLSGYTKKNPKFVYPDTQDLANPEIQPTMREVTVTIPKGLNKKILVMKTQFYPEANINWNRESTIFIQLLKLNKSKFKFKENFIDIIRDVVQIPIRFYKYGNPWAAHSMGTEITLPIALKDDGIIKDMLWLNFTGHFWVYFDEESTGNFTITPTAYINDVEVAKGDEVQVSRNNLSDPKDLQFYFDFNNATGIDISTNSWSFIEVKLILKVIEGDRAKEFRLDTHVGVIENNKPTKVAILVEKGVYYSGQQIPIRVKFSEPIDLSKVIQLVVNNTELNQYSAGLGDEKSSCVVFMYDVGKNSSTTLDITKLSNAQDLNGNKMDTLSFTNQYTKMCTIITTRICDAIKSITCNKTQNRQEENVTINIELDQDNNYIDYYRDDYLSDNSMSSQSVYAVVFNKSTKEVVKSIVELVYNINENSNVYSLSGEFQLPFNLGNTAIDYEVSLYVRDKYKDSAQNIQYSEYFVMLDKYTIVTIQPIIFVEVAGITLKIPAQQIWPSGEENEIYFTDESLVQLDYEYSGNATFKSESDFEWVVKSIPENEDANAEIIKVEDMNTHVKTSFINPKEPGEIYVGLKAINNKLDDERNVVKYTEKPIRIFLGDKPVIKIFNNFITIIEGDNAPITWTENVTALNESKDPPVDTDITIELFIGRFTAQQLEGQSPNESWNITSDINSSNGVNYYVQSKYLMEGVSINNYPKYTIRVSIKNPNNEKILSDIAYIAVKSKQVQVDLVKLDNTYFLDKDKATGNSNTIVIQWTAKYVDTINGSDITFKVEKNGVVIPSSIKTLSDMKLGLDNRYDGSYTIIFDKVQQKGGKDSYIITARGKNNVDNTFSESTFTIYVYAYDSLEILINGQSKESYNMDNHSYIESLNLHNLTTNSIFNLQNNLTLKSNIGINTTDYSWNNFSDLFIWNSTDSKVVSINYLRRTYESLDESIFSKFTSRNEFVLSGLKNGRASITTTHEKTNMIDKVDVNVSTLKDQLYLFKFYPATETTLEYINGHGEKKRTKTNPDGALALYEPYGINSDVWLKSNYSDGAEEAKEYTGILRNLNILSGEQDSTKYRFYPLNSLKLRQVATVDLYLKKEDGTPYRGNILLFGGVYKNNGYCQDTVLNGVSGVTGIELVANNNGKITISMDITKFWSIENGESNYIELTSKDKLQFIYEVHFQNDDYYPQLIYVDGNQNAFDIVKFADSIVKLVAVPIDKKYKYFISNQFVNYGYKDKTIISVKDFTGKVGINNNISKAVLTTNIMFWGDNFDSNAKYYIYFIDQYGIKPNNQESKVLVYPFSKIIVGSNVMTMEKDTVWIKSTESRNLTLQLWSGTNKLIRSIAMPFTVINMVGVEDLATSNEVRGLLTDLKESSNLNKTIINTGDRLIEAGLNMLSQVGIEQALYKIIISPGEEPHIYKAYIWAGNTDVGFTVQDNQDIYIQTDFLKAEVNGVPGVQDLVDMSSKNNKSVEDTLKESNPDGVLTNMSYSVNLGGYFEAQIEYNFINRKWEIYVLGGGFTAVASLEFSWTVNEVIVVVPVTATIKAGGKIGIDFKAAVRYSQLQEYPWTVLDSKVNDYMTTLLAKVYVKAFAGFGFDYSVVALKIGIFGQIEAEFQNVFLSMPYIQYSENEDRRLRDGQYLNINGTIGIEFDAVFLFFSVQVVLASITAGKSWHFRKWDEIQGYWKNTGSGLRTNIDNNIQYNSLNRNIQVVSKQTILETREYLDKYERLWNDENTLMLTLFQQPTIQIIQQNAYPNANPIITDDGELLIYMFDEDSTDISKTKIYCSTIGNNRIYQRGTALPNSSINSIEFVGDGDSYANIDGTKNFAVVTWVRQKNKITKQAGASITLDEQIYMFNSSEIMVSKYENYNWTTYRITDNDTPDLAPVIATNGQQTILAWRSVYSGNSDNVLNFSNQDYIQYTIFIGDNIGGNNTIHNLYNGTSGAVKGINVAMLKDGTSCIVYTLDLGASGNIEDYEIMYTVIGSNDQIIKTVRLTNDNFLNENPQVSTATVETLTGMEEVFIIAWHNYRNLDGNEINDISIALVDNTGILQENSISSINQSLGNKKNDNGGKFKFTRINKNNNLITNIAVVWQEASLKINANGGTDFDKDMLRIVKFIKNHGVLGLSAPITLCEMPNNTLIDNFDVYVSDMPNNEITAIILGINYPPVDKDDPSTYHIVNYEGTTIYLSNHISNIYTVTIKLYDSININSVLVDYNVLDTNSIVPISFTIENTGINTIESITIKVGDQENRYDSLSLIPNRKIEFIMQYNTGNVINDEEFIITGKINENNEVITTGTVYLNYPDLGISTAEIISEVDGKRVIRVTLYNSGSSEVANGNRRVTLAAYMDQNHTQLMPYAEFLGATDQLIINSKDELESIDEGHYTTFFTFNIKDYLGEGNEIPENGVIVFLNASIEEYDEENAQYNVLPELNTANNRATILFYSLIKKRTELVTISTEHEVRDGISYVQVIIQNNSLLQKTAGNIIICLLDESGSIIESQQIYSSNLRISGRENNILTPYLRGFSNGLLTLDGEEVLTTNFQFGSAGASVLIRFGEMDSDNPTDAELISLTFNGLTVNLQSFVLLDTNQYEYTISAVTIRKTQVIAVPNNKDSVIKINGVIAKDGSADVDILEDITINVTVTSQDETMIKSYTLYIEVEKAEAPPAPTVLEKTDTMVKLTQIEGQEYFMYESNQWCDGATFTSLMPNTEYNFATRIKLTDTAFASKISEILSVTTKESAKPPSLRPVLITTTESSITINASELEEYSIDNGGTWVSIVELTQMRVAINNGNSITFTGLAYYTIYEIISRYKFDEETQMESLHSAPLYVTTNHRTPNINENYITGIRNCEKFQEGHDIHFFVSGAGVDVDNPVIGDIRWNPCSWCVCTDEISYYADSIIAHIMEINKVCSKYLMFSHDRKGKISGKISGKYTLKVYIVKELFTINGWVFVGESHVVNISFSVFF